MRTLLVASLALLLLVSGCKRKAARPEASAPSTNQAVAEPATPAAPDDASIEGAIPAPSKTGLVNLCSDPNPYISNNAKRTLASWDAKAYSGAAIGMSKVLSLVKTPAQQNAALSSLAALKLEIDNAAAQGNAQAKEAAEILARARLP